MTRHSALAAVVLAVGVSPAHAGAFLFSGNGNVQVVTHPANVELDGSNPAPVITVCLDPAAQPRSGNPEPAILNALATYNRNMAVQGNVESSVAAGVPNGISDFETVFLHEVGHCIGMDHSALGSQETGCLDPNCVGLYGTISTSGNNGTYDLGLGADGMRGSRDDSRGDDANRHWYQRGVNNPFAMPPAVVDRNTFAVTRNYLPSGHTAVETSSSYTPCRYPTADTASLPGRVPRTQNTMFPVYCPQNAIRDLAPDDVNTLRIARAGADGTQGTGDDYVPTLTYVGKTTDCDIKVRFAGNLFGECQVSASGSGNNRVIADTHIIMSRAVNWHFNLIDTSVPPSADLSVSLSATPTPVQRGDAVVYAIAVANAGPHAATSVSVVQALPVGTIFQSASAPDWDCDAAADTLTCTRATLDASTTSTIEVRVDVPLEYVGSSVSSEVAATSALDDPETGDNSASLVVPIRPIVVDIFGDGFE